MQGLILAAGYGKRMLPLTKDIPKCLIRIGDRTILERIIDNFEVAGVKDIVIVVGHGREILIKMINEKYPHLKIRYCVNEKYLTTNTMRSLWCARNDITGDFIQCHGDLIFDDGLLKEVVLSNVKDAVVVRSNPPTKDEDENRVKLDGNRVVRIDKIMPFSEASGVCTGIYKFSAEAGKKYFTIMDSLNLDGNEGFEIPFRELMKDMPLGIIDVNGHHLFEIDNPSDLEKVNLQVIENMK